MKLWILILSLHSWTWTTSSLSPVDQPAQRWIGPDGTYLPFQSDDEVLEFLSQARILSNDSIDQGITRPRKLLLEKDGIQAHAVFRSIQSEKQRIKINGNVRWNFRDDSIFECAAYQLSRLLGLNNVPPVVPRRIGDREGTLQIWIEQAMTEEVRRRRNLFAPDAVEWGRAKQSERIFDNLVFNEDRNLGNSLIDRDWKLWLIDHTRSFHPLPFLRQPKQIVRCDEGLWRSLTTLERGQVRAKLEPFLRSHELEALFKRWERLVERIQELIRRKGEENVILARPDPESS